MSHLVIVRHGETELNRYNRTHKENPIFNGQVQTPLTMRGLEQGTEAGGKIATDPSLQIRAAISSDLERAVLTAERILAELPDPVPLVRTRELRERYAGIFEGKTEHDVFAFFPEYRDDPRRNKFRADFSQRAPRGENYTDVTRRVWQAVEHAESAEEGDILIVSHMHAIRCIVGRALRLTPEQIVSLKIPNACPIIIKRGNPYILTKGLEIPQST